MLDFLSQVSWTSFMIAMIMIELTPGPNMGWLAALSAQQGRKTGLIAVLGITLGLAVQVVAAATGLAAIAGQSDIVFQALRWSGVGFMLYLAWRAWVETAENAPASSDLNASFRRGLVSNLLNPKALVFYMVVVGQFTAPEQGAIWLQILALGGIHLLIAAFVHTLIVVLGSTIGNLFDEWRSKASVRLGFSLALAAIAVWIAFSTR
ncbi:LysE family translocator [Marivivens sp. LCG002]|uniref:LysE family translocator n=1 Tax=Marivivens sp. LCG002 TaxID=3051171 RepID=UPI00255315A4|nr:LysE family translocator [Marivivens sp. LCG002]WIV49546.1 LysE family translocator [Marivivens sp. LCG002]